MHRISIHWPAVAVAMAMSGLAPAAITDTVNVTFKEAAAKLVRLRTEPRTIPFTVDLEGLEKDSTYTVAVEVNADASTLPASDYALDIQWSSIKGTGKKESRTFHLSVEGDSIPDRERTLALDISVKSASRTIHNAGRDQRLTITVKPAAPELDGYNYLGYIGTNFDLVDGIQANNLFFAANVFIPRTSNTRRGMFLSLYGNRAVTSIDTMDQVTRLSQKVPTSDTTYDAHYATASRVSAYASDNLGAYICPLLGLGRLSDADRGVQYHFAPAAEFVWRRILRTTTYSNQMPSDTVELSGSIPATLVAPAEFEQRENRYEFKIGPGLFLSHDNDKISVHVYVCTGWSTAFAPSVVTSDDMQENSYVRQHDWFFSGRAWITEPTSGLTLQAEITNTFLNPQPFYVVTLSKAISFKNLGNFFAPITSR